jgi:hypothetical protein
MDLDSLNRFGEWPGILSDHLGTQNGLRQYSLHVLNKFVVNSLNAAWNHILYLRACQR